MDNALEKFTVTCRCGNFVTLKFLPSLYPEWIGECAVCGDKWTLHNMSELRRKVSTIEKDLLNENFTIEP